MIRKQSAKPVTARMYRHFAVVTLFATGALAVATSDSSADQLNSTLDEKQAGVSASGQELGAQAQPKVVKRISKANAAPRTASGWGPDESVDGGGGGTASSYIPQGIGGKGVSVGMLRQVKLTPEQFLALSAEEQEKVLARLNGGNTTSPAEQARNQQAIVAASLQRSGFEGSCSDC
ncbi:hypothetical protein U4960_11245 [Altererythrobacter sp. H2]|uniref:hypothetical protein n=1 Tax=Altererythrobacter sp. H2 TaxID=3108391 RepID=UPI002B4BBF4C|nr:hypothetical protein [Altererythrobacter sp. H2]WRK94869.1 hypothetical protein U4960_11245 [Altererythrobacter sp. H2]